MGAVYNNIAYTFITFSEVIIANIISIILLYVQTGFTESDLSNIKVKLAALVITGICMAMQTWLTKKMNSEKILSIETQQETAEKYLQDVLATAEKCSLLLLLLIQKPKKWVTVFR